MQRSLQPRFSLYIEGQDVTSYAKYPLTYREEPDIISTFSFQLAGRNFAFSSGKSGEAFNITNAIKLGNQVEFYGGTMDVENYRLLFKGSVKNINPQYAESGEVSVFVTAVGTTFRAAVKQVNEVYPSPRSKRPWANTSPIKASQIVRGIAEEIKIPVQEIRLANDQEFTFENPITQYKETDWAFLKKLSQRIGANVWGEYLADVGEAMFFVDKSAQMNLDVPDIRFVYPIRKTDGSYEYSELKDGDRIIISATIEQDLTSANANVRIVQSFDKISGEKATLLQVRKTNEQGEVFIKYYRPKVDESKLPQDSVERDRLKNIAANLGGDNNYTLEDVEQYFVPAEFIDDSYSVIDKPWIGITITAKIDGDVNIRSKRSYPVLGIGRYGSDTLEENYLLFELSHVFDTDGFTTELTLRL